MPERQVEGLREVHERFIAFAQGELAPNGLRYEAVFEKAYVNKLIEAVKRGTIPATEAAESIEKLINLIKLRS